MDSPVLAHLAAFHFSTYRAAHRRKVHRSSGERNATIVCSEPYIASASAVENDRRSIPQTSQIGRRAVVKPGIVLDELDKASFNRCSR